MNLINIYNTIIYYLGLPVPERFIELSGLFGLILATYGAFLLIRPLMRTDGDILKISQYETQGAVLGKGKSKKTNSLLQGLLQEDRETGFLGAKFIFVGFTLQLLEKLINVVYPIKSMPQGINWFFYIILIGAFTILILVNLEKIKKKSDSYKTDSISGVKPDEPKIDAPKEKTKIKLFEIVRNWWKNNQEKNSERYLEREEMKKDLEEYSKDVEAIYNSPVMDFQERTLEKASLIQNMHMQRKLNQATDGLKSATWILALATIVFAWSAIVDSPNSNYIITTLQGIVSVIVYIAIIWIALVVLWKIILFLFKKISKLKWKIIRKNGKK